MDWLNRLQTESSFQLSQTGLSRKVLRHLILSHEIRVGSEVLVVGCGEGSLVRFLNELGVKTTGYDESQPDIDQAYSNSPHLGFYSGELSERIDELERQFDVIAVRRHSAYDHDLHSEEAYRTTGELLSCLKPSGHFCFVEDIGSDWPGLNHGQDCFEQHLRALPDGNPVITRLLNSSYSSGVLTKILHPYQLQNEVIMASYQTPSKAISRSDWQTQAETAASAAQPCGCEFVSDSQAA